MTTEQWEQVRTLFHAALDVPTDQRASFLAANCSDDAVRTEVESLLSASGDSKGPVDQPALEGVRGAMQAALSENRNSLLSPGQTVGHYEILTQIGAGGMGEVYRARDTRLKREVALKVVSAALASDPDRLARFQREAVVLASLNHPNIAQIYGFEDRALVMELVEGQNLKGPLPLQTALTYAKQMAEALEYAHEKGIVHRDLKPANVKITPQGVVKLLDFGLAKAVEQPGSASGDPTESPTVTLTATQPGLILGTAAYMSPEQATGKVVDKRSDVWSFGVVLWEMLTGSRLFHGDSVMQTLADVLRADIDFNKLPADTPMPVRELMERCLDRDPKTRLRDLGEARVLLQKLLANSSSGSGKPTSGRVSAVAAAPTIPSTRRKLWAAAGLVVTVVGASATGWIYWNRPKPFPGPEQWKQITDFPDSSTDPALSPDGRTLAFMRGSGGWFLDKDKQLYVKNLPDGPPVQLTHDPAAKTHPAFSPDGARIAYTVGSLDTWVVPVLGGGEPRLLLPKAAGLTWIDSDNVLFSEDKPEGMGVETAAESRLSQREIFTPAKQDIGKLRGFFSSLSPDRKQVLIAVKYEADTIDVNVGNWRPCRLASFDGKSKHLIGPNPGQCTAAAWTPDGKWMYFTAEAGQQIGSGYHLWRQRTSGGMPEQVTFGPTDQQGVAIAPDGRSLYSSVGISQRGISIHDPDGDHLISGEGIPDHPYFSRDGKSLYYANADPSKHGGTMWVVDIKTGQSRQVLPGVPMTQMTISLDGKTLYYGGPDGKYWAAAVDRQTPQRLLPVQAPAQSSWSGTLYFLTVENGQQYLNAIKPDGTGRHKVFRDPVGFAGVTPDEKLAIYTTPQGIVGRPLDGGPTRVICAAPKPGENKSMCKPNGSPDGSSILITFPAVSGGTGTSVAIPSKPGDDLPSWLPPGGITDISQVRNLPGAIVIPYDRVTLGPHMSYAYIVEKVQQNIYQIPLP